jgi:hypothetical protein
MKSSFELAMERLNKSAPTVKLNTAQKAKIAELESKAKAKIAEREIASRDEVAQAAAAGEYEKVESLQQQLVSDRKKIQADLEEKKEAVRSGVTS